MSRPLGVGRWGSWITVVVLTGAWLESWRADAESPGRRSAAPHGVPDREPGRPGRPLTAPPAWPLPHWRLHAIRRRLPFAITMPLRNGWNAGFGAAVRVQQSPSNAPPHGDSSRRCRTSDRRRACATSSLHAGRAIRPCARRSADRAALVAGMSYDGSGHDENAKSVVTITGLSEDFLVIARRLQQHVRPDRQVVASRTDDCSAIAPRRSCSFAATARSSQKFFQHFWSRALPNLDRDLRLRMCGALIWSTR